LDAWSQNRLAGEKEVEGELRHSPRGSPPAETRPPGRFEGAMKIVRKYPDDKREDVNPIRGIAVKEGSKEGAAVVEDRLEGRKDGGYRSIKNWGHLNREKGKCTS